MFHTLGSSVTVSSLLVPLPTWMGPNKIKIADTRALDGVCMGRELASSVRLNASCSITPV